ncbi:MAG: chromosome partitioning protein ParB [Oceanospirillaceae bacterium]|jgi:ParB family chromosome partitioning protein|uniref:ParB/RepB/Spo0J family partition protein n=1 Tax=Marinobacterium litorale TaxID=404770 RepID=UPI00041C540A|nr:ParB/RepB/Spo0J family partition protein [Marinobacterium litorale]MBS99462.1 chromosome partitioning protein ParB [Oceanospirillaceae bacterium]
MAVKKRGLGRGLDALLSSVSPDAEEVSVDQPAAAKPGAELMAMPLNRIQRGRYQPRRDLEPQALEELAASIQAQGVMQPIVIRPVDEEMYEIIAGERRWRAAQMAGLDTIPVVIRDVPDEAAIAMALIENIQRENLNPMEEAIALHRLQTEFELTQQQVADAVGKSRSTITNLLRLMNLTDEVKRMLEYGDMEMGHARALLPLEAERQIEAANEVVAKGLSVRQTEALVRKIAEGRPEPKPKPEPNERCKTLSSELSRRFSVPVEVRANAAGKGKISLSFKSEEELDAILQLLS